MIIGYRGRGVNQNWISDFCVNLTSQIFTTLYFYHHRVGHKQLVGLFVPSNKKGHVYVVDTVRTNQMPNLTNLYNSERSALDGQVERLPEEGYTFEVR